jgi:hypothetical protein
MTVKECNRPKGGENEFRRSWDRVLTLEGLHVSQMVMLPSLADPVAPLGMVLAVRHADDESATIRVLLDTGTIKEFDVLATDVIMALKK